MDENKFIKKEIRTVGDLKKLLDGFHDDRLLNFGTKLLGFEISHYGYDSLSLALMSDDLEEYLEKNDMS